MFKLKEFVKINGCLLLHIWKYFYLLFIKEPRTHVTHDIYKMYSAPMWCILDNHNEHSLSAPQYPSLSQASPALPQCLIICRMGNTDSIPVVSQVKSLVQVIAGDEDGARKTQENFIRTGIVASQVRISFALFDSSAAFFTCTFFLFLGWIWQQL